MTTPPPTFNPNDYAILQALQYFGQNGFPQDIARGMTNVSGEVLTSMGDGLGQGSDSFGKGVGNLFSKVLSNSAQGMTDGSQNLDKGIFDVTSKISSGLIRGFGPVASKAKWGVITVGLLWGTPALLSTGAKYLVGPWSKAAANRNLMLQTMKARQQLIKYSAPIGVGVIASGGLVYIASQIAKSTARSKEHWAKAQADIFAEGGKIMELLKGAIERINPAKVKNARFAQIIGQDEAKEKFQGIFDRLANPHHYRPYLGADEDLVTATILDGPPGVGKTQMVRALNGELTAKGVPAALIQFHCSKLAFKDSGPRAMDALKQTIDKLPLGVPAIIFLDEIETIGNRNSKIDDGRSDTINSLLTLMDGVTKITGRDVIWIGATNHYEKIDDAIKSRFTGRIPFSLPTVEELDLLYKEYTAKRKLQPSEPIDWPSALNASRGFSGRDVQGVMALIKERRLNQLRSKLQSGQKAILTFNQSDLMKAIQDMARKKMPTTATIPMMPRIAPRELVAGG